MKLFTIGFTKSTASAFFSRLRDAGVARVLDTRANRSSQLAGFSKEADLKFFLSAITSIDYQVANILAPDKTLLKAYRSRELDWDEYARRYVAALSAKKVEQHFRDSHLLDHACLLCSEHEPDQCHRRLAAEYLREASGNIEIKHL